MRSLVPAILFLCSSTLCAQELEPRLLTNVPRGGNFLVAGYNYTQGDLLLDPSLPVKDLNGKLHSFVGGYVRTFGLLGKSAKADIIVPYAIGHWEGKVNGIDSAREQSGFGDIRARISWNFIGAPSVRPVELASYSQDFIAGTSLQVVLPTGIYDNTKLINIGSNRFTFKGTLGASQKWDKWIVELYSALWVFGANSDFFNGRRLTQRPLGSVKIHVIRTLPKGNWVTVDGGYAFGGRSAINGDLQSNRFSSFRFGITLAFPIQQQHTVRVSGTIGRRLESGPNFESIAALYQYGWFDKAVMTTQ